MATAEQALHAKDFDGARAAAEQAAGLQPHEPTVHLLLGRLHIAQGRPAIAVEELRRALRLDPLRVAAHRHLGYALIAIGRFAEAIESWDQWERLAASSPDELAQLPDVQRARDAARVFVHG
ncbi:MAG: tetratricopeptide repeat protein [Burkholderiales bacterium]